MEAGEGEVLKGTQENKAEGQLLWVVSKVSSKPGADVT